jgi:hypothetical protein
MDPIPIPQPKSIRNPDRPASSLLLAQVQHLHEAEGSLPPQYHCHVFIKAIRTEGEAANYIREVTEAIHAAHHDAAAQRQRRGPGRKHVMEIAAPADERVALKQKSLAKHNPKVRRKTGK